MFEAYKVAVKLTVVDEFSKGILAASTAFDALDLKVLSLNKNLKQIRGFTLGAAGILGGIGVGIAAPLIDAVSKAAQLQKQLLSVQIATRGTADQMDAMRIAMEKASSTTIFSTYDVASMAKIIATSNSFNAPQLTSLLPEYARFADVQSLMKGTDYETSVREAVRLAHTAQLYSPKDLGDYLDTLTKASILSSGNISELGTALKYSQGTAQTALGVDPKNMVLLTALLNRLGFAGSRGGTNLIDGMIRTIPGIFGSGLLKGKSNEALRAMGLVNAQGHSLVFNNGKFDAMKWMQGLAAYISKEFSTHPEAIARQDILTNFQHAFGAQGRRVASLLASPQALQQFLIMEKQFEELASTGAIQDTFVQKSTYQQYKTAVTNFQNAMIELGTQLLPLATTALNHFNYYMTHLTSFMQNNKEGVKAFADGMVALSVAFVGLGTLALITTAITGLLTPVGALVAAFFGLGAAITALLNIIHPFAEKTLTKAQVNNFKNAPTKANLNQALNPLNDPVAGSLAHSMLHPFEPIINVNIDGRTIAKVVTKYQNKAAASPQASATFFDPISSLMNPAYSGK